MGADPLEESEIFLTTVLSDSTKSELTWRFLLLEPPIIAALLSYKREGKMMDLPSVMLSLQSLVYNYQSNRPV